jgi:hypothetical protein
MKTTEEIVKLWETTGLLDDLDDERKTYVAQLYNTISEYMITNEKNDIQNSFSEAFDIIFLLVKDLSNLEILNFDYIKLLKEVVTNYPIIKEKCQDVYSFGRGYLHDYIYKDEFFAKYKKEDYQK